MFRFLCGIIGSVLVVSDVCAMTFIGPPAVEMEVGQWSVGGAFCYSEQDIEVSPDETLLREVEIETRLVRVGVGVVTDRVELFGLLGGFSDDEGEFHGKPSAAVGGGLRATITPGERVAWGTVAQVVYADLDYLEIADVQIAFGACSRRGPFRLYGGPFIHLIDGTLTGRFRGERYNGDLQQDSAIGAYIGGGIDLWEHLTALVEGQWTGGGNGAAFSVAWRF